jgi:lysophospholipase L1-like esterase
MSSISLEGTYVSGNLALFGDSMLGRFTKPRVQQLEHELGDGTVVFNCATGGWDSRDGALRAPMLGRLDWSTVVLSFGGNDCAPWKHVPIEEFITNIAAITAAFQGARLVAFLPPMIREIPRAGLGTRSNKELDAYRDVLRAAVGPHACLDTAEILRGTGLEDDGLHLTGESYTRLIPVLAQVITG